MKRIFVNFLSIQPIIMAAVLEFFSSDPVITPDITDFNKLNPAKAQMNITVVDDGSLHKSERQKFLNGITFRKTIIYTSRTDPEDLFPLFFNPALSGIVSKKSDMKILRDSMLTVADGQRYLCANTYDLVTGKLQLEAFANRLSEREIQILDLVIKGYKNKQISDIFFISTKTVETHKQNIKIKLGLNSLENMFSFKTK